LDIYEPGDHEVWCGFFDQPMHIFENTYKGKAEEFGNIMAPIEDEVLRAAIDTWGPDAQHAMLVGEIGELLTLYGKEAQGRAKKEDWIDEIADVLIMLRQVTFMRDISDKELMDRLEYKIDRIRERL